MSEGFLKLEKGLVKILNKNMKIRSNFEFSIKRKNIINTEYYRMAINRGYDMLINMALIELSQKQLGMKILEEMKI